MPIQRQKPGKGEPPFLSSRTGIPLRYEVLRQAILQGHYRIPVKPQTWEMIKHLAPAGSPVPRYYCENFSEIKRFFRNIIETAAKQGKYEELHQLYMAKFDAEKPMVLELQLARVLGKSRSKSAGFEALLGEIGKQPEYADYQYNCLLDLRRYESPSYLNRRLEKLSLPVWPSLSRGLLRSQDAHGKASVKDRLEGFFFRNGYFDIHDAALLLPNIAKLNPAAVTKANDLSMATRGKMAAEIQRMVESGEATLQQLIERRLITPQAPVGYWDDKENAQFWADLLVDEKMLRLARNVLPGKDKAQKIELSQRAVAAVKRLQGKQELSSFEKLVCQELRREVICSLSIVNLKESGLGGMLQLRYGSRLHRLSSELYPELGIKPWEIWSKDMAGTLPGPEQQAAGAGGNVGQPGKKLRFYTDEEARAYKKQMTCKKQLEKRIAAKPTPAAGGAPLPKAKREEKKPRKMPAAAKPRKPKEAKPKIMKEKAPPTEKKPHKLPAAAKPRKPKEAKPKAKKEKALPKEKKPRRLPIPAKPRHMVKKPRRLHSVSLFKMWGRTERQNELHRQAIGIIVLCKETFADCKAHFTIEVSPDSKTTFPWDNQGASKYGRIKMKADMEAGLCTCWVGATFHKIKMDKHGRLESFITDLKKRKEFW
ncbi:MAG: hypothetical protein WC861_02550 [Candidatus Micrarchaeia archaeon]|jgi:hypothetical protein